MIFDQRIGLIRLPCGCVPNLNHCERAAELWSELKRLRIDNLTGGTTTLEQVQIAMQNYENHFCPGANHDTRR